MLSRRIILTIRSVCIVFLLVIFSTTGLKAGSENEQTLEFNSEYALKKSSGAVMVYFTDEQGEKVEYLFNDFNADVVLYVYRRIGQERIVSLLADKYRLSKTEARRRVKMAINTMEIWEIIQRS